MVNPEETVVSLGLLLPRTRGIALNLRGVRTENSPYSGSAKPGALPTRTMHPGLFLSTSVTTLPPEPIQGWKFFAPSVGRGFPLGGARSHPPKVAPGQPDCLPSR